MRDFEYSVHNNLRLLPPSTIGLIEHAKRAAYEAGWVAYQSKENVDVPIHKWGWKMTENGQFEPKWQEMEHPIDALLMTAICSCKTAKCAKCQCSKHNLECIANDFACTNHYSD